MKSFFSVFQYFFLLLLGTKLYVLRLLSEVTKTIESKMVLIR